jgi:hypothetical protein
MRGDEPPLSFIDFFEYFKELKKILGMNCT